MTKLEKTLIDVKSAIREEEKKTEGSGKGTNHILHLLLSIVTAGIWVPIWILIVLSNTNVSFSSSVKKLEELYQIQDEIELRLIAKRG